MTTIPEGVLSQHVAVLGKTGSGKSYAVRGAAVEPLLDAGARVCIVDPTGAWHGLRSSASGTRGGYPVVIFGGQHGDLPLGGAHGEPIAEVIGASSTPAILDTSAMKVGERTRFFADFADAIIRKNRGPLHLVVDEAHLFMPQGKVNDPQSGAMLHAANNMVSLGRSRGLRIIMISQRPAKLHKDALTQAETLIAMRLIAPQDRAAVEAWIKDNASQEKAQQIITSLATLKTGQGWIWAPEIGVLERVTFPKIKTFDSGRAPDGSEAAAKVLAPIDLDAIAGKLQAVSASALADDPKRLRARISELEKQLAGKGTPPAPSQDQLNAAARRAEVEVRTQLERLAAAGRKSLRSALHAAIEACLGDHPIGFDAVPVDGKAFPRAVAAAPARRAPAPDVVPARQADAGGALPRGEAATLAACIQFPEGLKREQLTVLTGYKRSTRDAYIQRLRERGYLEAAGDRVVATEAGAAALPDAQPLPTGDALQQYWLERLPAGEREILRVLIDAYPDTVARGDILPDKYARSSRDAYLQRMAAKMLVDEPARGEVRATETLFE